MQTARARVIFSAAVDVFSTRGFDGATMDEIAQKANVAKGTIYYHFNSKEDLFLFLVAEGTELLHEAVLAKLDADASPTANLETAIREQLHFFQAYRDFCTIIVREAWGDDTRQRQFRKMLVNYVRTLAAIIDAINRSRPLHVVTVEDPIEFIHDHKRAIVTQREVGQDTKSFAEALRRALRQDPDVILVGEMRDLETISTALTAAETGHLVLATLHTQDAPSTIDRVIDVFPPSQQEQIRIQLASSLAGVVTQQLVPTEDGKGRRVAAEVLVCTPAVQNLVRGAKTHQIYSLMQTGAQHGMQTMDQSLAQLVRERVVSEGVALDRCRSVEDFRNHVVGR
jgi:AcrR family transcriptional regulator